MRWWDKFHVLIPLLTSCAVVLSAGRSSAQQMSNHHIKTVFIIVMENKNWFMIKDNPLAPYINGALLPNASHTEVYFNPPFNHPSLPNYLWLETGTNFGIYNDDPPSINHQSTPRHLVTLLENAGVSWKAYAENIDGRTCPLTDSYPYAVKHNPFVYFDNVTDNLDVMSAYCIAHVRPFQELATDLMQRTTASYNFIIPNVCDDMHDACPSTGNPITDTLQQIRQGDAWLSQNVPMILGSAAYQQGALFLTWDEAAIADGPIGMIVLSPFAKGHGYENFIYYEHGSTLRTMQEIFGVMPLLRDARRQRDLRNLFAIFP